VVGLALGRQTHWLSPKIYVQLLGKFTTISRAYFSTIIIISTNNLPNRIRFKRLLWKLWKMSECLVFSDQVPDSYTLGYLILT